MGWLVFFLEGLHWSPSTLREDRLVNSPSRRRSHFAGRHTAKFDVSRFSGHVIVTVALFRDLYFSRHLVHPSWVVLLDASWSIWIGISHWETLPVVDRLSSFEVQGWYRSFVLCVICTLRV